MLPGPFPLRNSHRSPSTELQLLLGLFLFQVLAWKHTYVKSSASNHISRKDLT